MCLVDGEGWREVNVNPQLTEDSLVERKMVKGGERSTSIPMQVTEGSLVERKMVKAGRGQRYGLPV